MINFLSYHYKINNEEIRKLTVHQFNQKMEFLNKILNPDKEDKQQDNSSVSANSPAGMAIADNIFGVK